MRWHLASVNMQAIHDLLLLGLLTVALVAAGERGHHRPCLNSVQPVPPPRACSKGRKTRPYPDKKSKRGKGCVLNSQLCALIRRAVFPSQKGGIAPFLRPEKSRCMAGPIASGSVPINSLVPSSIISGLDVSYKVMQGTPLTVVSSVMPPRSVTTTRTRSTKWLNSR